MILSLDVGAGVSCVAVYCSVWCLTLLVFSVAWCNAGDTEPGGNHRRTLGQLKCALSCLELPDFQNELLMQGESDVVDGVGALAVVQ